MLHRAIPQKIAGIMNLCASNHKHLEPDDPALVEEHKLLLSKFMEPSSRGTKEIERVSCNNFETVFHSQTSMSSASNTINDEFSAVTNPGVTSGGRKDCNAKVALGLPTSARKRSTSNLSSMDKQTFSSSASSVERDSSSPGPSSTRSLAPRTRRSTRSRNKQINYYPVISLSESDSGEGPSGSRDTKTVNTSSQARNRQSHKPSNQSSKRLHHLNSNTDPLSDAEIRIIYSSRGVQIRKLSFTSLDHLKDLKHAPFCPEHNPAKYARRYRESMIVSSEILHVDFDSHEMTAMLGLLSLHGCQYSPTTEISISDQVIAVLSSHDVHRDFAKKISLLRELAKYISNEAVIDTSTWLWEVLTSKVRNKNQQSVRHCLTQLLTLKGMAGDGALSSSPAVIKQQLQIFLSCLPHASILYRRQPADIGAFIQAARNGHLSSSPSIIQAARVTDSNSGSSVFGPIRALNNVNALLQNRELGGPVKRQLRTKVKSEFSLLKTWKGASNDVNVLAWSPDGTKFAAGATAQCDEGNMEYNRGNNLVIGDLTCNRLEEVPGHYIIRPPGRAASQRALSDNRLFMSVTAMQWFDDTLFTASYDNTVKLWRFSGNQITNHKTLPHESKVLVMARSNFEENLLATGAQSFRLWNIMESKDAPLIIESRRDLTPTCLAWGSTHDTKHLLLAGMSERDDGLPHTCPAPSGFLTGWHVGEASIIPTPFQPNSQNIFDIKWHPTLPRFATASTVGQSQVSRGTRSVVRVYEPLKWKSQTIEFECPALDINDITFCPMNSYYVTASCTNGVTYVWDYRKRDQVLLELSHGEPLNQLDELLEREQDDVGVRMALWGDEINQFYTGASDGIVKQWNILRAQEDALTKNVFGIEEEIMCGAFSSDKSNLLIGDAGGGIHILSTSNSSPHEGRDPNEDERKMQFRHAAQPPCDDHASDSESGLVAARKLLNSGKLKRHPVFGVGQGPHYDGPYAGWARPGNPDKPHLASLRPDVKMRQLDGPAPKDRIGLDEESRQLVEAHIQLARIRNQRRNEYKRKRTVDVIDLCSDEEDNRSPERQAQSRHIYIGDFMGIANLQCEVIDLTGDTDTDSEENASIARARSPCFKFPKVDSSLETLEAGLEDDFWWPDSGQVNPNFPQEA
ncbi:WD repeat protein [Aspergillus fumigatus Af293]|uniref:WD repeat protein n=1 Tax=Aspergillus fumigatus (strain ATCC MYA-4609 / CBS 101355 / FGSC A1100 / Af293) TaxID=330879 RepID=Q4WEV2_ASPFU|nr:WD repeat protein [Aspergillus fumigatus Af293]EAL85875.1 WD repeat protein [Aspergillus fumigatus Af293]